jgi:DNA repair protein RadC
VAVLDDGDLLAVLLGTGLAGYPVGRVAAALLAETGGLEGLARLGPAAIAAHAGVGPVKALRVAAAIELGRRAARRIAQDREPLTSSAAVAARLAPDLVTLRHEELWVVCLDGRNHLRAARRVAQGGLHHCTVAPGDVLRRGLYEAATSIILVHNHPSGDPTPSPEDLVLTRRIADAADIVGMPLVDHVILAPSGEYRSLLDMGMLGP